MKRIEVETRLVDMMQGAGKLLEGMPEHEAAQKIDRVWQAWLGYHHGSQKRSQIYSLLGVAVLKHDGSSIKRPFGWPNHVLDNCAGFGVWMTDRAGTYYTVNEAAAIVDFLVRMR